MGVGTSDGTYHDSGFDYLVDQIKSKVPKQDNEYYILEDQLKQTEKDDKLEKTGDLDVFKKTGSIGIIPGSMDDWRLSSNIEDRRENDPYRDLAYAIKRFENKGFSNFTDKEKEIYGLWDKVREHLFTQGMKEYQKIDEGVAKFESELPAKGLEADAGYFDIMKPPSPKEIFDSEARLAPQIKQEKKLKPLELPSKRK